LDLFCVFFGISPDQVRVETNIKVGCSSINFEVKHLYIFCEMAEEKCWIETRKIITCQMSSIMIINPWLCF